MSLQTVGRDHGLLPRLDHRKSPGVVRGGESVAELPIPSREADTDGDLRGFAMPNPANIPPTDFEVQEAAGAALGNRYSAKALRSGPQR